MEISKAQHAHQSMDMIAWDCLKNGELHFISEKCNTDLLFDKFYRWFHNAIKHEIAILKILKCIMVFTMNDKSINNSWNILKIVPYSISKTVQVHTINSLAKIWIASFSNFIFFSAKSLNSSCIFYLFGNYLKNWYVKNTFIIRFFFRLIYLK